MYGKDVKSMYVRCMYVPFKRVSLNKLGTNKVIWLNPPNLNVSFTSVEDDLLTFSSD